MIGRTGKMDELIEFVLQQLFPMMERFKYRIRSDSPESLTSLSLVFIESEIILLRAYR